MGRRVMDLSRRAVTMMGGMGLIGLAMRTPALMARSVAADATSGAFDSIPFVHPELRFLVPQYLKYKAAGSMSLKSLPVLRKMLAGDGSVAPGAQPVTVPGSGGSPDVRAYLLRGDGTGTAKPGLLYVH